MFEWVHYQFPSRIFLEHDSAHKIGTLVKHIGKRVLLVTIREEMTNPEKLGIIQESLNKHTSGCILYDDIAETPDYAELDTAAHFAKQCNADIVMAFGTRKSLNAAKAIALLSTNEIFAQDLPRSELPLRKPPLPVVSVPSGPALGDECSPSFYLYDSETRSTFHSIDTRLFPALVFLDPSIAATISSTDFVRSAVAILATAAESILSKNANDITTSMALRSIEYIIRNKHLMGTDTQDPKLLRSTYLASIFSGIAHSNTQLGACYAIATAANNLSQLNFDTTLTIVLPHLLEYNLTASAAKYVHIARALEEETADITVIEAAIKAVEKIRKIIVELKIPERLSEFGVKKADLSRIAQQASQNPLLLNSPRDLDKSELEAILIASF